MGKKNIGGFGPFWGERFLGRCQAGDHFFPVANTRHKPTEPEAETDSRRRVGPWNTIQMAQDGVGLFTPGHR